jgi:hypothetical protein
MLSVNPLALHGLSKKEADDKDEEVAILIYEDPNVCTLCDQSGSCALHLVAKYSESLELLQDILQIDHKMTKINSKAEGTFWKNTNLGLLCSQLSFSVLDEMVLGLIKAESDVEVISNGILNCLESYEDCINQDSWI